MKKINIFGILNLFVTMIVLFVIKFIPKRTHYKTVKISNKKVKAEVADTLLKRIEGLIPKKTLLNNEGMLFIFNKEGYHGIWMMNMNFPIDVLWINKNLEIVHIVEDAQPCKINCVTHLPNEKALYVLEVNSGFVAKNKLHTGNSIAIV